MGVLNYVVCYVYVAPQRRNALLSFLTINLVAFAVSYWSCFKYFYLEKGNVGLLIGFLVLWLLTIVCFCSTTFRDPGMIGKQFDTDFIPENREFEEIQRMREDPINFENGLFKPVRMS